MKKYTKNHIISRLTSEGLTFSEFTLVHEGDYAVDDADWNYKDVPHLHYVHELAEAIPTIVGDDLITSVNMQKVLCFRFPFSLTNFESGENSQTYYTTWMFYVLMIETRYVPLGPCRTRVETTYAVGSPKLLKWTFPIIRWILKRNYDNLMSTDIPMRTRRGELRGWGYGFKKLGATYSFEETMDVMKPNVVIPKIQAENLTIDIDQVLPSDGEYMIGRSDHLGLRLVRSEDTLALYPRLCPHEGANLDESNCEGKKVKCKWHGRAFAKVADFSINSAATQQVELDYQRIELDKNIMKIFFK